MASIPPMQPLKLYRELRLRDLEIFLVRRGSVGQGICFLLIVDHGRPSTIDDFPSLKGICEPEDFGRKNFIQVIALHPEPLSAEEKDDIIGITNGVVEGDGDCDYVVVFEALPVEALHDINESRPALLATFERILAQHGVQVDLSHISEEKWGRLSQD